MADVNTANLCKQIIDEQFGPIASNIAEKLLTHGRLSLGGLIRFTQLKPRPVRACILALVQQNILWHATTPEEGEILEINVEETLSRLRHGRYVRLAEVLFGEPAADIVQLVLDHGKLQPPTILSNLYSHDTKKPAYETSLHTLVTSHYLKASIPLQHQSPRDKLIKYEAEERKKIPGLPTSKQLSEARDLAEARLKIEEREAEKIGIVRKTIEQRTKSTKRKHVEVDAVDDGIHFGVNYDRFNVHIRNQLIVEAARDRFNDGAAEVMKAALKASETKQLTLSDSVSDPVSVADISTALPTSSAPLLSAGLITSASNPSTMALIRDYLGLLSSADNPTPAGRASSFLSFSGTKTQVEFGLLAQSLQLRVIDSLARERHGEQGLRVVRLLRKEGKMSEATIGKTAMLAPKDVRPLLSAMAAEGLVAMQEVPRSADRNPSRMFYLWYVDPQKTAMGVLAQMYKVLFSIGRRRVGEGESGLVKAVLEKRRRSDVEEDVGLLSRNEREVLEDYEGRCERLTVLEMRVEEAVFVLRDLGALITYEK